MILRLMVVLYSWAWNVPTWNPQRQDDWVGVLFGILFMDFPAITFIGIAIYTAIHKRKK